MAYFDNAATTYPKPEIVYQSMDQFQRHTGGSFGRGNYGFSSSAKSIVDDTRAALQQLLHCPAKQVIFEPSATISLNIIIQGIIEKGARNIYISPFEHNAVTRTLHHYETMGLVKVVELTVNKDLCYDIQRIRFQFENTKPDLVIVSHASNVIGLVAPVEEIFTLGQKSFTRLLFWIWLKQQVLLTVILGKTFLILRYSLVTKLCWVRLVYQGL